MINGYLRNILGVALILCPILFHSCLPDKGVNCTEEYRMLTVSVKDSASKPVILSNYFVKKTSTGEVIDFSSEDPYIDSINRIQGIYFLMTDGKMGMTSKSGTEFEFLGLLDSVQIVDEKYIVGNDDCHVIMLSGKTEIVISK